MHARRTVHTLGMLAAAALLASCGGAPPASTDGDAAPAAVAGEAPAPGAIRTPPPAETSTDLERTPLGAADYALYAAIMGGASAMLADLSPEDRAALELEKRVKAGAPARTADAAEALARARALHARDIELARIQGVEPRYVAVKRKVEAVIGPRATPPAADDRVAQENLRYLDAHRANIERLQRILDDPLSRDAAAQPRVD